jgi:hypothetical protein
MGLVLGVLPLSSTPVLVPKTHILTRGNQEARVTSCLLTQMLSHSDTDLVKFYQAAQGACCYFKVSLKKKYSLPSARKNSLVSFLLRVLEFCIHVEALRAPEAGVWRW